MTSDPDIWRAPRQLIIKRHGDDAAIAAAQRADQPVQRERSRRGRTRSRSYSEGEQVN